MSNHREYPVTITMARYSGVYEGGRWVAFHCYPRELPWDAFADDTTCSMWWGSVPARWVGRGGTPNEARQNLIERLERGGVPDFMQSRYGGIDYAPEDDTVTTPEHGAVTPDSNEGES